MIRSGPLLYEPDSQLLVRDESGSEAVARYHVGVGDARVVIMPDGRLKSFPAEQTADTDRPFQPLTINQLRDKLLDDPRLKRFKFKTIQSRRFLYVYNTSEPFIRSTRTILETMYPAVRKYFQRTSVDTHEPEFPLVILAFATDDQYQEFRRMPTGIVAYYDPATNYVALYEQSKLNRVAPEIAIKNTISTIAHEGVHQILHNIGVQQRLSRWPMWLSEGLPEFFAPTSVSKGARWAGLGATNVLRMHEIETDWKQQRSPLSNGETLRSLVQADQLESLEYAYSWALIHMLAKMNRKELFACVRECSEWKPLSNLPEAKQPLKSSEEVFTTHFGDEFVELERGLLRHLKQLDYVNPVESQTHYLVVSGLQVSLTTSPERVKQIRSQASPLTRVQVRTFPNRATAERAMRALTQGR